MSTILAVALASEAAKARLSELSTADLLELRDTRPFRTLCYGAVLKKELFGDLAAECGSASAALDYAHGLVLKTLADRGLGADETPACNLSEEELCAEATTLGLAQPATPGQTGEGQVRRGG